MIVLRHNLAALCEMFSVTPLMVEGQVEDEPLHGLHAPCHIRILWIFTCGGHLIILVYAALVDKEEALHRILDACQSSRSYPGFFERVPRPRMRRVEACIEFH
jgi:hypothetical protein